MSQVIATSTGRGGAVESITIMPRGSVASESTKRRRNSRQSGRSQDHINSDEDYDSQRSAKRKRYLAGPGADVGAVGEQFKLLSTGRGGIQRVRDEEMLEPEERTETPALYLEVGRRISPSGSGRARTIVYDKRVPGEVESAAGGHFRASQREVLSQEEDTDSIDSPPPWLAKHIARARQPRSPRAPRPKIPVAPAYGRRPPPTPASPALPASYSSPHVHYAQAQRYASPISVQATPEAPFSTNGRVSPALSSVPWTRQSSIYEAQMDRSSPLAQSHSSLPEGGFYEDDLDFSYQHSTQPIPQAFVQRRSSNTSLRGHVGPASQSVGARRPSHHAIDPTFDSTSSFLARAEWQDPRSPHATFDTFEEEPTRYHSPNHDQQFQYSVFNEAGPSIPQDFHPQADELDEMATFWKSASRPPSVVTQVLSQMLSSFISKHC
ncbi:hypothetical protein P7C70_g6464, partial [Phenoliferia sp. Uapishka_3]